MNLKRGLFFTLFFLIFFFPLFSSEYPDSLSKDAIISIVDVNYNAPLKSPFSKAAFRIYDKNSGFDEIIDFSFFSDFNNPMFPIEFYFFPQKAEIISLPFLDFAEHKKSNNAVLSEVLLNLSSEEISYIFDFLKNLNENLPNYEYDFDLTENNSFTHISAILNDAEKYFNDNNLTTNRSFFNYSRKISSHLKKQNDSTFFQIFSSESNFDSQDFNSIILTSKANVNFSFILTPIIFLSLIFLLTIYQTLVLFFKKFYIHSLFKMIQNLDFLILFFSGIIGTTFLLQDYFSTQSVFRNNFRFLYFFPFNIVMAFNIYFSFFKNKFLKIYFIFSALLSLVFLASKWIYDLNFPLLDFFLAFPVFIRSVYFAGLNFLKVTER